MKQNDFDIEFGFLPPQLVFKMHEFVSAYHDGRGSGWPFVRKAHIRAERSGYLSRLERTVVAQRRVFTAAISTAVCSLIAAAVWSLWFVILTAVACVIAIRFFRLAKFNLIQERALILAIEMVALDFAGWGEAAPFAKEQAESWLHRIGFATGTNLLDAYIPASRRAAFVDDFRPSEA